MLNAYHIVLVTEQEVEALKKFVSQLNSLTESVVIVEGKKDTAALKKLGLSVRILEFHRFRGMVDFADRVSKYEKLIILFDGDRKGKYLTGKTIQLLQRRTKVDLTYKQRLNAITKGKIRFIEQLVCYESYLV